MNKLVRGVITGSLIGAGVGVAMLVMKNRQQKISMSSADINRRGRSTIAMVRDNAMRWTSAIKSGTETFTRKLAQRGS